MTLEPPIVVYHAAAMGNWQEVVREQMLAFREAGLHEVRLSHVGGGLSWIIAEAARQDVAVQVVRSDPNTDHYETFAMFEIERLAREEADDDRPILYCHTKGVSAPHNAGKALWRRVMAHHVVHKWRQNRELLKTHDAVGWNWWYRTAPHFSGNFWMANKSWLRKLPPFAQFHNRMSRERYSCERWIGATPDCRAFSHGCHDISGWIDGFDWTPHLPRETSDAPTITWLTAATPSHVSDLQRLIASFPVLGPGHQLVARVLEGRWQHTIKLRLLRELLRTVTTSHVLWIDGDCEFLAALRPSDLIDPAKQLVAVRHFASSGIFCYLPERLHHRVTSSPLPGLSWQGCLFGGSVAGLAELLAALRWMDVEAEDYDEHGLVIELDKRRDDVHTLPCRYAAPSIFTSWPVEYQAIYRERAGGTARICHHNRATYR